MGASDINHFDNNDATDWLYDLRRAKDDSVLRKAFAGVIDAFGRLETPECAVAIGAAEVVAAMQGHPTLDLPDAVHDYVERISTSPSEGLAGSALKAIQRVRDSSELQQMWDNREDGSDWRESLSNLEDRLSSVPEKPL